MKYCFTLLICLLAVLPADATHLMGGHLSYEYVSTTSNGHQYRLKVEMFRDCNSVNPNTGQPVPFDNNITLGVFEDNSPYQLQQTVNIFLNSETIVDPPFAEGNSDCDYEPDVCVRRGYYETVITVPSSSHGYHILHERCCRNVIENLGENVGQAFYAKIPPTHYQHSSPTFDNVPVPFICQGRLTNLHNNATDPDGDSLSYHFHRPHTGGSEFAPAPQPEQFLSLPIDVVTFEPGHSYLEPFGTNGTSNIFSESGLTQIEAPQLGFYVMGIEVRSHRNNQHIGSIYRDMQVIVIDCPPNPPPELTGPGSPVQKDHVVEAGATISFNITAVDPGFELELSGFGGPLGNGVEPPNATLPTEINDDHVTSTFTWNTACHHASDNPYVFTIEVEDDGCPANKLIENFSIEVIPPSEPEALTGPENVCQIGSQLSTYEVTPGSTEGTGHWSVSGGTIRQQPNDHTVRVEWENETGTITYSEVSPYGCELDKLELDVDIVLLPAEIDLPDITFCGDETPWIGNDGNNNLNYSWSPSKRLSHPDSSYTQVDYSDSTFSEPFTKEFTLLVYSGTCSTSESQLVEVLPPLPSSPINGLLEACAGNEYQYTYKVSRPNADGNYSWSVEGAEITEDFNDSIYVSWNKGGRQFISLTGVNSHGCRSDTTRLPVEVSKSTMDTIKGPTVVCPNNNGISYEIDPTPGSIYHWQVEGGEIGSGQGDSIVYINWFGPGEGELNVVEELENGCLGDTVRLQVLRDYDLKTSDIMGPDSVCANEGPFSYYVFETENSVYNWHIENGTILEGQGSHQVVVSWQDDGEGVLEVSESSFDSVNELPCQGIPIERLITVYPYPEKPSLQENMFVCQHDTMQLNLGDHPYHYNWNVEGATYMNGEGSPVLELAYSDTGEFNISVYATNQSGCKSEISEGSVTVFNVPNTSPIEGELARCPPDRITGTYSVKGFDNSEYHWKLENGTIIENFGNKIQVEWHEHGIGRLEVQEVTLDGCQGEVRKKEVLVDEPRPFMDLVTTKYENDEVINIEWNLENDDNFNRYFHLYKQENYSGNWRFQDSFAYPQGIIEDPFVITGEFPYNYKIAITDLCGDTHETNVHRSINLQGEKTINETTGDELIDLNWNHYKGWSSGSSPEYKLYRRVEEAETYEQLNSFTSDTTHTLDVMDEGYEQCFRIAAHHNMDSRVSWSNETCFTFKAIIYVPNAFSPNEDGINDKFEVFAANLKDFRISIYSRWGDRVFESNDPDVQWDGTLNEIELPEGVYVYMIDYESIEGKHSLSGSVTLIR